MTIAVAPRTPPRRASLIASAGQVSANSLDGSQAASSRSSSRSTSYPHHPPQPSPSHHDDGGPSPAPAPRSPIDPSSEDYDEEVAAAGFAITAIKHRSRSSSSSQPPQKPIPRAALQPITPAAIRPIDLYTTASNNEPVTHRKLRDDGKPRRPSASPMPSPSGPLSPSPRRSVGSTWSTPSSSSKRSHDDGIDGQASPSSSASPWSRATTASSSQQRGPTGESPPKRSRRPTSNQPLFQINDFGGDPIIPPIIVVTPPDAIITPTEDPSLDSTSPLSLIDVASPKIRKAIADQEWANARLRSWLYTELEDFISTLASTVRGQQNGRAGNYAQMERIAGGLVLAMERMLGVDPQHDPRSDNDFFGDGRRCFIGPKRALWWQSSLGGAKLPGDDEHGSWTARLVQEERRGLISKFFDEVFLQLDMAPVPLSLPEVLAVVCSKLLSRPDVERLLFEGDDSRRPVSFADHLRKFQLGPRTPSTWRTEGTMRPSRLRRVASIEQGKAFDASPGKPHEQTCTFREMLLERFDELLQRGQLIKERSVSLKVPTNPRNTLRWAAYRDHEQRLLDAKMARLKSRAISPNGNEDEKLLAVNGRLEETFASLHCVRFLGELYRQGVVELDVISKWLHRLLFDTMFPGIPSLWELESGCVLLITILPKLHEYQRQDGRAITMQRSFSAPQGSVKVGVSTSVGPSNSSASHSHDLDKMDVDPPTSRPDGASADHWIRTTPRRARLSALSKHSPVRKMEALCLDSKPAPSPPLLAASSSQHQQPQQRSPANIAAANLLHSCLCRLRELQEQPDVHAESKSWIAEVCRLSENTIISMPVTPPQQQPSQQRQKQQAGRRQQPQQQQSSMSTSRYPLMLLNSSSDDDDDFDSAMRGRSLNTTAAATKSSSSSLTGTTSSPGRPSNRIIVTDPSSSPVRPPTPSSRHRLKVERDQRREMEEREAQAALKAFKHAKVKAKRAKQKNTSTRGCGSGSGYSSGSDGASSQLVGEV